MCIGLPPAALQASSVSVELHSATDLQSLGQLHLFSPAPQMPSPHLIHVAPPQPTNDWQLPLLSNLRQLEAAVNPEQQEAVKPFACSPAFLH